MVKYGAGAKGTEKHNDRNLWIGLTHRHMVVVMPAFRAHSVAFTDGVGLSQADVHAAPKIIFAELHVLS